MSKCSLEEKGGYVRLQFLRGYRTLLVMVGKTWLQKYETGLAARKQRDHILSTHRSKKEKTGNVTKL